MGNKKRIAVCTDDIRPLTVEYYWKYWKFLKANHPNLKLNAFVIPHYFKDNFEVITKKEFWEWYDSVKDWVDVHLHGYAHTYPPECTLPYNEQENLIVEGAKMLSTLSHKEFGFKAPGYHYSNDTVEILKKLKFRFFCHEANVMWLRPLREEKFNDPLYLYQTHTNGISDDSIENIYEDLNVFFKDKEFLLLNELTE